MTDTVPTPPPMYVKLETFQLMEKELDADGTFIEAVEENLEGLKHALLETRTVQNKLIEEGSNS